MTGTQNHEGIAGTLAAIEYLADLGHQVAMAAADRRTALLAAYEAIRNHEQKLARRLLDGLTRLPGVRVWGITNPERLHDRVPTVSFTHKEITPVEMVKHLDSRGIYAWHGNFYASSLTEALGLEPEGMVRIGLLHYNTMEEVDRLLAVLAEIVGPRGSAP
jgi:selenocysteine lyase/cysteine desulfurase